MFALLPRGCEVLGAGVATMLSNVISVLYVAAVYRSVREKTVLELPKRLEKIENEQKKSLYSVGIPAAFAIFLFDLVTMVLNRLTASYGDIPLAAMGIVLKLERLPLNVGFGVCLDMVPLVAYNYASGNARRMERFVSLARTAVLSFSVFCVVLFRFFAEPITGAFIRDEETVHCAAEFLRVRCFAVPFMLLGYHIVNFMNAALAGPLMVSVGFEPIAATALALVFNTVPVPYGAVGTPTNTAIAVVSDAVSKAGENPEQFASQLPFTSAVLMGLLQVVVLALQNTGGAIGNMICINNVVSASATTGINGNEGRIIRMNLIPCLVLWLLLASTASVIVAALF